MFVESMVRPPSLPQSDQCSIFSIRLVCPSPPLSQITLGPGYS